jgi:putative transposase
LPGRRVAAKLCGMGRPLRASPGGYVYHVLNRANGRMRMFHKDADYEAFERIIGEALEHVPGMRLTGYCLMPNHWHLLLWPRRDGELSDFGHWLALTHTQRWRAHYHNVGMGHLYQGRFKSFVVASDEHYFTVLRYVERNALRAGLVEAAQDWRFGSLWRRGQTQGLLPQMLTDGPVELPETWAEEVNRPQTEAELAALRQSVRRGQPYGATPWVRRMAQRLGLESTLRPRGRPPNTDPDAKKKGS